MAQAEPLPIDSFATGFRNAPKPPDLLKNRTAVERRPLQMWPTKLAAIQIVDRTKRYLGINTYQLGKLVGIRNMATTYRWLTGDRRPSAYYLQQMLSAVLERAEQRERERDRSSDE